MAERKLTGKIAPERILMTALPRPDPDLIAGFLSLGDASGILSDIMDELGITGVLPASWFKPTIAGACIAGPALTVRNIALREHPHEAARAKLNRMAEFEAHNLAEPGDVIVIDGVAGVLNMGGISAQTWRIETVEINGEVSIGGIRVSPGDIAFADDTGVCFIPRGRAREVLDLALKKAAAEDRKCRLIDEGVPVAERAMAQSRCTCA